MFLFIQNYHNLKEIHFPEQVFKKMVPNSGNWNSFKFNYNFFEITDSKKKYQLVCKSFVCKNPSHKNL